MKQDLFAPFELIEPLSLMADVELDAQIIIRCNGPGYICEAGSCQ
ncbi:MAG TPA: hypothetical protein VK186_13685 [Candidatus Deferrimicrobium sp.]|nr:hypothetical protein [Candidatus Kapabacteria bacterium]HLP59886.1 hypothetical protein [Candidatus Deferrimicrobium sp.]